MAKRRRLLSAAQAKPTRLSVRPQSVDVRLKFYRATPGDSGFLITEIDGKQYGTWLCLLTRLSLLESTLLFVSVSSDHCEAGRRAGGRWATLELRLGSRSTSRLKLPLSLLGI
jgi:hypothetical protein